MIYIYIYRNTSILWETSHAFQWKMLPPRSVFCRIRVTGSSNLSGLVRDLDARTAFITSRGLWPKHVPGPQQKREKNTCGFLPKPWENTKETNRKVKWYQTKIKQLNMIPKKDKAIILKWWSQWRSTASYQTNNKKSKISNIFKYHLSIKWRSDLNSKVRTPNGVLCILLACVMWPSIAFSGPFLGCFELRFLYKRYLWAPSIQMGENWEDPLELELMLVGVFNPSEKYLSNWIISDHFPR